MKKRLFLLSMVLVMFMCGGFSLAEQAEVGGDSLDECVQRMVGYTIETEDGSKMITASAVAFEYYAERSENGTAVLPYTLIMGDSLSNLVSFVAPGLSTIIEIDVMTDDMLYQIIQEDKPFTSGDYGLVTSCSEELTEVLNAMGNSENVTLRFFENGKDYKDFALGEQQIYLLKQFGYTMENFMPRVDTKSWQYQLVMGIYGGYTIKKTELDSSTAGVKNEVGGLDSWCGSYLDDRFPGVRQKDDGLDELLQHIIEEGSMDMDADTLHLILEGREDKSKVYSVLDAMIAAGV
ncbi:MAG: hypothetical protein RR696_14350 [Clostridia bacterium]